MAVDGHGKFLFVCNPTSNDISMFQIDQSTGAITEVPDSPFAAPGALLDGPTPLAPPSGLISISAEASGTYIYAGYSYITGTDASYGGGWVVYQINTTGSSPTLQPLGVNQNGVTGRPRWVKPSPPGERRPIHGSIIRPGRSPAPGSSP